MPRFSRKGNIINSNKQIVDSVSIGVAAGVVTTVTLATALPDYIGTVGTCPTGAKISSIYLFCQIQPQAAQGNCDWYIAKGEQATINNLPAPGLTGGSNKRRYVLHEEKGIPGVFNNGASPLTFRGVIKIPRGRQRFGEDDRIQLKASCPTVYDLCIKCIYKFYT